MTVSAIGIDLGGTNLRACLVDATGSRRAEAFEALPREAGADALIACVAGAALRVGAGATPIGIGVGIAGALDRDGRLVAGMTNLPALAGRDVAAALAAATRLSCRIENDARAAVLGEARFGAAQGMRDVLLLTLGTGIGGGLLLDGRPRSGPSRLAGEIGLVLSPVAGVWQPLEDVASPGGLRRTQGLDAAALFAQDAADDPAASARLDEIAEHLAIAIVNAHVLLDLELILLSGGMTRAGDALLGRLRAVVARRCPPAFAGRLEIAYAGLGEWAGAMGAAALWLAPQDTADEAR